MKSSCILIGAFMGWFSFSPAQTIRLENAEKCINPTLSDNLGSETGQEIDINYLDPQAGGVGGDITFTIPHATEVDRIRITGSDGFTTTIPTSGTFTALTINSQRDASPSASMPTISYQVFLGTESPTSPGTFIEEEACPLIARWAPPSCSVVFDEIPAIGQSSNLDIFLTNVIFEDTTGRFARLIGPNSLGLDLNNPTVVGNRLRFEDAYTIGSVTLSDKGTYQVTSAIGPSGSAATCSEIMGLGCPIIQFDCLSIPSNLQLGNEIIIPLVGENVTRWEIGSRPLSISLSGATTFFRLPFIPTTSQIGITAYGFDEMGRPCSDTLECSFDFEDPTSQITPGFENPANCPDGIPFGTQVPWSIETTNAISVSLPTGQLTPNVDPRTNYRVTWTGTIPVQEIGRITATVRGR